MSDSQLAAVLASSVADVLEKRAYRSQANRRNGKKEEIASGISGFSVFGPVSIGGLEVEDLYERSAEDQSGRVRLGLLHDAAYDINQAPIAWWHLRTKAGKASLTHRSLPAPLTFTSQLESLGTLIPILWHQLQLGRKPSDKFSSITSRFVGIEGHPGQRLHRAQPSAI
jgi:hypothetical protein